MALMSNDTWKRVLGGDSYDYGTEWVTGQRVRSACHVVASTVPPLFDTWVTYLVYR